MMSSIESTSTFDPRLVSNRCRNAQCPMAPWRLSAYMAAGLARLRELAPYAVIELVLPGGSLIALLLWLYRRYKKQPALPRLSVCLAPGRRPADPP
jgi:hypothetical protein